MSEPIEQENLPYPDYPADHYFNSEAYAEEVEFERRDIEYYHNDFE